MPFFADEPRNAQMLAKHGGAIVLTKFDLESKFEKRSLSSTKLVIFTQTQFLPCDHNYTTLQLFSKYKVIGGNISESAYKFQKTSAAQRTCGEV
ncbi:unnamed protein product [Strongylus vulgaris]|uniref:Glucuronosyltransferase n=1 Tax=Strongylus vulgaris TaxID=40348 RepID=A0A3P7L4G7_STRVU|nr:unnamed protein product [Strongylus vulgaris]